VSAAAPAAALAASRCGSCGLVAFPAERYGCERCGAPADDHEAVELPANGRIASFAEVHRHHQPEPPTPFVVAAVDVDGGPALKGVLVTDAAGAASADRLDPAIGERVTGRFDANGDFRWVRVGAGIGA
jgi:uncharacterized OB-fold protein